MSNLNDETGDEPKEFHEFLRKEIQQSSFGIPISEMSRMVEDGYRKMLPTIQDAHSVQGINEPMLAHIEAMMNSLAIAISVNNKVVGDQILGYTYTFIVHIIKRQWELEQRLKVLEAKADG